MWQSDRGPSPSGALGRDARTCKSCPERKNGRVSLLCSKDWGGAKERKSREVRVGTAQDSMEME